MLPVRSVERLKSWGLPGDHSSGSGPALPFSAPPVSGQLGINTKVTFIMFIFHNSALSNLVAKVCNVYLKYLVLHVYQKLTVEVVRNSFSFQFCLQKYFSFNNDFF